MANNSDDVNYLYSMFGDLNKSVVETIYHANGKDIDKAVDEILNFGAGQDKTGAIDLSNSLFLRSALNPEEEFLKGEAERRKRLQSEASREHTEKLEREARQRIEEAERKRVEEERRLQQDLKLKLEREAKLRAEEAERRRIEEEKQIQEQQRLELELLRAEMEARKSVEREAQEARQQAEARIKEMNIRLEEEKRNKEEIERLANQRFQEALEQRAVAEALEKQALEQRLAFEAEKQKLAELTRIEKERVELARQQLEREELARQEKERADLARIEEERARVAKEAEERAELERKEAEEVQRRKEAESARKFSIYTRQTQDSQQAQDIIVNQMKELLLSNLICVESEIALIDISCDFELARYLKDVSGGEKFPLLTFQDKPIGNLEQLSALLRDEDKVAKLRQGEYDGKVELKDGTGIIVGQGALDHCLDAAEYVISGVGSLLWLPVSIVTWPFRSEKAGLSKGPNDVDFEIVHTNWYWRNLKRRFRFGAESILRIHPVHQDVRATHPYSTIKCVKLIDSKNIVIEYADSSSPDYIQAVEKDIELMVQLLRSRCADNKEPTEFITAPTPVPSAIEN